MKRVSKFFALYYDYIYRRGKSLSQLKTKILKDKIYNKISGDIYNQLMRDLNKQVDEQNSVDHLS